LKSSSRESVVQSARNFKLPLHQAPPQPPPLHQEVREKPRAPPPQSPLLHQEVLEKPRVLPHQLSHPQLPQLHQVVKVASEFWEVLTGTFIDLRTLYFWRTQFFYVKFHELTRTEGCLYHNLYYIMINTYYCWYFMCIKNFYSTYLLH